MGIVSGTTDFLYSMTTRAVAQAIAIVSPKAAAKYIYERALLGGYDAAKKTGPNQAWRPSNNSGTYENARDLSIVKGRTRDLARNNGYVVGSVKKIISNTIGSELLVNWGIKDDEGKLDRSLNSDLYDRFALWATEASLDGKSFFDFAHAMERGKIVDGEMLVNKVVLPKSHSMIANPFRVQALETDYLNTNDGVLGIYYDDYNKPKTFNVYKSFPEFGIYSVGNAGMGITVQVSANNMMIVYNSDRASTYRGISELAPLAMGLYSIDQLEAAEMDAIRSASAFGVIVTSPFSADILTNMYNEAGGLNLRDDTDPTTYIDAGAFHFLRPGEDAKAFKNERPNANLMPFINELLYKNSSALGVAAEEMTNNYTKVNYSSARQSSLVAKKLYLARRAEARRRYLDNVVMEWLKYEILTGKIKGLSMAKFMANPAKYRQFSFTFPGFDWVDPLKEIAAVEKEIALGLNTREAICAGKNRNFAQIVQQLSTEKEQMIAANIWQDAPIVMKSISESASTSQSKVVEPGDTFDNNDDNNTNEEESE